MEIECTESKTTLLPVAKQINISSILYISLQCDLSTDSVVKEWDAPIYIITIVLWGYIHSPSQGLFAKNKKLEL